MTLNFPTGMLFVDPRTNSRIPGAQLSFFFSGTSGFTSVYQDAALTQLWTQPIAADANGNFPPNIYFDPFQSVKVRVQLASAQGVVKWIVDPYFVPLAITQDSLNLRYPSSIFEVRVPAPPLAGTACLVVNNIPGSVAVKIIGGVNKSVFSNPAWSINNITTGAQRATMAAGTANNKPGPTSGSTPSKWLSILSGGVTYYVPCFL